MNLDIVKEYILHPIWTSRHYLKYYGEAQQQIREANQELSEFFGLEPVEVSTQFKKPALRQVPYQWMGLKEQYINGDHQAFVKIDSNSPHITYCGVPSKEQTTHELLHIYHRIYNPGVGGLIDKTTSEFDRIYTSLKQGSPIEEIESLEGLMAVRFLGSEAIPYAYEFLQKRLKESRLVLREWEMVTDISDLDKAQADLDKNITSFLSLHLPMIGSREYLMRNPGPNNVADFLLHHFMILGQNHDFGGMLLHTDKSCPIKICCKHTVSKEAITTKFSIEYQPISLDATKNKIQESLTHPVDDVGNRIYQTLRVVSKLLKKLLIEDISDRIKEVYHIKK